MRRSSRSYAQTVTYALLLTRFSGTTTLGVDAVVVTLPRGHNLLSHTLKILTDAQARAEIAVGIDLLERSIAAIDIGRLTEAAWTRGCTPRPNKAALRRALELAGVVVAGPCFAAVDLPSPRTQSGPRRTPPTRTTSRASGSWSPSRTDLPRVVD